MSAKPSMTEDPAAQRLLEWVEQILEQINNQIKQEATKEQHERT